MLCKELHKHEVGGARLGDYRAGIWSVPECKFHINFLGLKAVLVAQRKFEQLRFGQTLLIVMGNTTAVSYINKDEGIRSDSLFPLLVTPLQVQSQTDYLLKAVTSWVA